MTNEEWLEKAGYKKCERNPGLWKPRNYMYQGYTTLPAITEVLLDTGHTAFWAQSRGSLFGAPHQALLHYFKTKEASLGQIIKHYNKQLELLDEVLVDTEGDTTGGISLYGLKLVDWKE